jgi:hypothetical protein
MFNISPLSEKTFAHSLTQFLQQAHWLSLDVTLGAVICSLVFWRLPDGLGQSDVLSSIMLGVAVFLVYSADRLLDLRKQNLSDTARHKFHQKHSRTLWEIIAVLGLFSAIFASTLPREVLQIGFIISFLVILYLVVVNRLPSHSLVLLAKEPITAVVFSLGIIGPAFISRGNVSWQEWALAALFFLIVLQNILLFSMYEAVAKPQAINISNFIGKARSRTILTVIFLIIIFLGSYTFAQNKHDYIAKALLVLMVMSSILWMMNDFVKFFIQDERYRWLGDGVFMLMLAVLIF